MRSARTITRSADDGRRNVGTGKQETAGRKKRDVRTRLAVDGHVLSGGLICCEPMYWGISPCARSRPFRRQAGTVPTFSVWIVSTVVVVAESEDPEEPDVPDAPDVPDVLGLDESAPWVFAASASCPSSHRHERRTRALRVASATPLKSRSVLRFHGQSFPFAAHAAAHAHPPMSSVHAVGAPRSSSQRAARRKRLQSRTGISRRPVCRSNPQRRLRETRLAIHCTSGLATSVSSRIRPSRTPRQNVRSCSSRLDASPSTSEPHFFRVVRSLIRLGEALREHLRAGSPLHAARTSRDPLPS